MGPNDDGLGPRFPDMSGVWDRALRDRIHAAGRAEDVELREGVYLGLTGPTYETPAEIQMLRVLGADAAGMSTVLEAMAANWAGLRVCGVSLVTNAGAGLSPTPLTHAEVIEAADEAGPHLARVIGRFTEDLAART
jgi:purine-nucleoside phosphorylase